MLGREDDNPNSYDPPPSETVSGAASRATGSEPQQVMGAQIAGASTPHLLNGTYGTMGPMSMDSELRPHPEGREVQGNGSTERAGRAAGEPVAGALRTAGRVMANVAAKVQGMIPPAKVSSAASFLGQEEVRSAGTVGAGYVTAGSATMEEQHVEVEQQANEEPQASGAELFSPQQARRLREMEQEAPLLYSERRTEQPQEDSGPVRAPPLPHYSSSESGQAEAIQAEVRRQMQAFMVVQSELQGRVAALVEENQMLRQVASSNVESVPGGSGLHAAKGSWFSGLKRNLMGFVQQVPGKSAAAQFDGGYAPQVTCRTSSQGPVHDSVQASGHVEGQERHAAPPPTGAKGQGVPVPAL